MLMASLWKGNCCILNSTFGSTAKAIFDGEQADRLTCYHPDGERTSDTIPPNIHRLILPFSMKNINWLQLFERKDASSLILANGV